MKRGLTILGFIVVLAVGFYWLAYPWASLRYEITVEVEADGEVYSGTGVHEVTLGLQPQILTEAAARSSFKGEAVAVDIGDRGTLFILLTGPSGASNDPSLRERYSVSSPAQFMNGVFEVRASSAEAVRALPGRVIDDDVPFNRAPLMVRFGDITDPLSVTRVNPYDLAASFGEGVELRSVHVRTTRARVTSGIEDRLPWLASRKRGYLDGARIRSSRELTNTLHYGHFRVGFLP